MSFATQVAAFAAQAARERQAIFAGPTDDAGYNLRVGTTTAGRRLRVAFSVFANDREATDAGFERNVQARALLPDSYGLTLALGDDFTCLAAGPGYAVGDVFRIVTLLRPPHAAETRVGLRKLNP